MTGGLWQPIPASPVSELIATYRGTRMRLLIKHEGAHPAGSVKARTAVGLLRSLDESAPLLPGTVVVESTSGNLGMALAQQLHAMGCRLVAVVDPKTPTASIVRMRELGTEIRLVDQPDGHGGYLLSRLAEVHRLRRENPGYRWTNQYENRANLAIHEQTTGPEILEQGGPELDAVFVAVSTGGTLEGVSRHIRSHGRLVRVVAVDTYASLATGHSWPPGAAAASGASGTAGELLPSARQIPGIGASRPSSFLGPGSYDTRIAVRDHDAVAVCRLLREDTGMGVGGSSGFVVAACLSQFDSPLPLVRPLCLSADDSNKYEDSIYDDEWLGRCGLATGVQQATDRIRADGLRFELSTSAPQHLSSAGRVDRQQ